MILGIDVSHHQGVIDMAAVAHSGRSFVIPKASEGTTFVDPNLAGYRRDAHAAGLVVGLYHFARAGDPAAEAAHFVQAIGALAPGEFLVLDWEVPAADPVGWCRAWLDAVHAATDVRPLLYLNASTMTRYDWSPIVAANYGLWLAKYDRATTAPAVAHWSAAAMKQYSDRDTVPGIAGGVDCDVFYGTADQLRAYGAPASQAAAAPAPPAVGGEIAVKYAQTPGLADLLGAPTTVELGCPDGRGRYNHFERGSIYWTPEYGAYSVRGAIRDLWAAQGWETGPLGYPQSDECTVTGFDRTGQQYSWQQSNFERGSITWTPDQGAYAHVRT